jgi:hypothetical protein
MNQFAVLYQDRFSSKGAQHDPTSPPRRAFLLDAKSTHAAVDKSQPLHTQKFRNPTTDPSDLLKQP